MVPVKSSCRRRCSERANRATVAVGNVAGELLTGLGGHLFVDPVQPLGKAADVVVAVAVLPDVVDDLDNRSGLALGRLGSDAGGLPEVIDQCAVEAVEDDEVGFIREMLALAGAPAEHLLEQDAGFDRAQEDDEFEVGDVHAGREHVHGDDDAGLLAVAELANLLKGPVHAASDLADEGVALAEHVAGDIDQVVGVGSVR